MLKKRLFGIMILIVGIILEFCFISCKVNSPLDGTWVSNNPSSPGVYTFSGSDYEFIYPPNTNSNHKGTFSLNSNKTQLTLTQTHSGSSFTQMGNSGHQVLTISISSDSPTIGYQTYTKELTDKIGGRNEEAALADNEKIESPNEETTLVGKWVRDGDIDLLEFFSDGIADLDGIGGQWVIDKGQFIILADKLYMAEISGSTLTLFSIDNDERYEEGIWKKVLK